MNSYQKLSPEAQKEVDAMVQWTGRHLLPLSKEHQEMLKKEFARLALSCYAAEGIDTWKRMYYDLRRQFEGEQLTEKQIAEKGQAHREFLMQEGQLRA